MTAYLLDSLAGTHAVSPLAAPLPEPTPPEAPGVALVQGARGTISGDMDAAHLGHLAGATVTDAIVSHYELRGPNASLGVNGFAITYDLQGRVMDGSLLHFVFEETSAGAPTFSADLTLPYLSAAPLGGWVQLDQTQQAFASLLSGNDWLGGKAGADLIRGFGGADFIEGQGGNDAIFGGDGADVIFATYSSRQGPAFGSGAAGSTYLRGDDGNDVIYGAGGFDDINGNVGNDTAAGGAGDDWVVGGKDNDALFGEGGGDIVYGNLGDDTCVGGDGNDVVRGGQGNDILWGSTGDDYVSGDRGDDTITGGAGADNFHGSQDAGIDRIVDFNRAEGDRIQLDAGTTYILRQVGADAVLDMGGGHQMILVDVQASTLTGGWVFLG